MGGDKGGIRGDSSATDLGSTAVAVSSSGSASSSGSPSSSSGSASSSSSKSSTPMSSVVSMTGSKGGTGVRRDKLNTTIEDLLELNDAQRGGYKKFTQGVAGKHRNLTTEKRAKQIIRFFQERPHIAVEATSEIQKTLDPPTSDARTFR